MKPTLAALSLALLLVGKLAHAEPVADNTVLTLSASVSESVEPDQMRVVLAVERTARDMGPANKQVLTITSEALARAKGVASVTASLGQLATVPVYDEKGKTGSWRVRAELTLTSKNFEALSVLSGQLSERLELTEVGFGLSKERNKEVQENLLERLGAEFARKAARTGAALGYSRMEIRNIALSDGGVDFPVIRPMARSVAIEASFAQPIPTAAAKTEVSVSLTGTVALQK